MRKAEARLNVCKHSLSSCKQWKYLEYFLFLNAKPHYSLLFLLHDWSKQFSRTIGSSTLIILLLFSSVQVSSSSSHANKQTYKKLITTFIIVHRMNFIHCLKFFGDGNFCGPNFEFLRAQYREPKIFCMTLSQFVAWRFSGLACFAGPSFLLSRLELL